MRVLFQTIGVLVQYNWALPYFMTRLREDLNTLLITDAFSYLMGGFYYHLKQPRRVIPIIASSGVFPNMDKTLEDVLFWKFTDKHLIHLNKGYKSKLTTRILKMNAPKIFTFHGSLDQPHVRDIALACKELREINKSVRAFIAVSDHSAKTIEENCGFKPLVIHNGVDISIFNPFGVSKQKARKLLSLPENIKLILWSGRIDPDKGLHVLVKALRYVVKNCENITVIVKGRTVNRAYLESVKALSSRLGVGKYIKFTLKWTPNIMMLYYYYRASDVYIHTSISEGFPLTLIEAMASGIPVIGNNASSIPEAIGYKDLLFSTIDELSEKLMRMLYDEKTSKTVGTKLFKRVIDRGFTSIEQAKKYLNLYEEIIDH